MIEDLRNADTLEKSKEIVLKVITGKRLLTHDGHDLNSLGISTQEINKLNVEVIDTSRLYNIGNDKQAIGLAKLADFFILKFWDRTESRSLIQGQTSERDARVTLTG